MRLEGFEKGELGPLVVCVQFPFFARLFARLLAPLVCRLWTLGIGRRQLSREAIAPIPGIASCGDSEVYVCLRYDERSGCRLDRNGSSLYEIWHEI